ncbi:MAG: ferritin-like domain-containing protein [Phycisphaerae bacterium]|mgnify:CR=1 FL=1|nr:ferritin-like domain-containing protein [Phycisphaerae bacterium]
MLNTVDTVLEDHIKDLYNAEKQLVKALPKMAKGATDPALAAAFEAHLRETLVHVERLDKVAALLEIKPTGKKCRGMEGLIEEGSEVLGEDGVEAGIDTALIAAAQKVEHYEISAYGTAVALAERLGNTQVAKLLNATLAEEKDADKKLSRIASKILPELPTFEDDEGE